MPALISSRRTAMITSASSSSSARKRRPLSPSGRVFELLPDKATLIGGGDEVGPAGGWRCVEAVADRVGEEACRVVGDHITGPDPLARYAVLDAPVAPFETSSEGTSRKSVHPPEQIHVRPLADGVSGRAQWRGQSIRRSLPLRHRWIRRRRLTYGSRHSLLHR